MITSRAPQARRRIRSGAVRSGGGAGLIRIRSLQLVLLGFLALLLLLTLLASVWLHNLDTTTTNAAESNTVRQPISPLHREDQDTTRSDTSLRDFAYWRSEAVRLAQLSTPSHILQELETKDPFGVRHFEAALLQVESDTGHFATPETLRSHDLFPCPPSGQRLTIPDQRNLTKMNDFQHGQGFLFFQHLRKAGGTNFCTLAEQNLPKAALPPYYCMPDYHWGKNPMTHRVGAGYLHHWPNADIIQHMTDKGHRVAGNEWDMFDATRHFDLPAVFATSFRRPVERAFSQFRFECLEDRGCHIKNVTEWWDRRQDLHNIYLQTFADPPSRGLRKLMQGTTNKEAQQRGVLMGKALDVVAQFHLVTVMEWLAYAAPLVQDTLGFTELSSLTTRVRPHIRQAPRHDGPNQNKLGAKGVIEANLKSKEQMPPEQYQRMSEDLALDEILTDAARRIFLERLVCGRPPSIADG